MIQRWLERAIPGQPAPYKRLVVRVYAEVIFCIVGPAVHKLVSGLFFGFIGRREKKIEAFLSGASIWGERVVRATRTRLLRFGNIDAPQRGHMILVNHVNELDSAFDSLVLRSPYLANEMIKNTIFAYWWMKSMGSEVFDRRKPRTIAKSVRALLAGLERRSYIVYPEGSNGYVEEIRPLRKGMIELAYEHRIPVYIVLKSGLAAFREQPSDNVVGYTAIGTVRPEEFADWRAFRDHVHALMAAEKPRLDARVEHARAETVVETQNRVWTPTT